jgi:predicted metalloprotease with PDZ domain
VLGRFHLWIDYPHDALHVVPVPTLVAAPFERARLGIAADADAGHLRVIHVAQGSPAAAAGFRAGERIASIDGRPAAEWTPSERRALATRAAGTVVTFHMEDGTLRTVALADYY